MRKDGFGSLRRAGRFTGTLAVQRLQAFEGEVERVAACVEHQRMRGGRATACVCKDFTCLEPVTDPAALQAALR